MRAWSNIAGIDLHFLNTAAVGERQQTVEHALQVASAEMVVIVVPGAPGAAMGTGLNGGGLAHGADHAGEQDPGIVTQGETEGGQLQFPGLQRHVFRSVDPAQVVGKAVGLGEKTALILDPESEGLTVIAEQGAASGGAFGLGEGEVRGVAAAPHALGRTPDALSALHDALMEKRDAVRRRGKALETRGDPKTILLPADVQAEPTVPFQVPEHRQFHGVDLHLHGVERDTVEGGIEPRELKSPGVEVEDPVLCDGYGDHCGAVETVVKYSLKKAGTSTVSAT